VRELNLLERIETRFNQMSKAEKKIAKYFLNNYSSANIVLSTITEFAERQELSEASVVRFCKKLDYSGYLGLKNAWQELLLETRWNLTREVKEATDKFKDVKDGLYEAIRTDISSLQETLHIVSEENFEKAVHLISNADCVYVLGFSIKAIVAQFLGFRLRRYRIKVELVNDGGNAIFESLFSLGKKDVVVIFDFDRIHEETLVALTFAKDRGAKIIAITDSSTPLIGSKVDVALIIGRPAVRYFNSLAPAMGIVSGLTMGVAKYKECIPVLEELDAIREKYSPLWHKLRS